MVDVIAALEAAAAAAPPRGAGVTIHRVEDDRAALAAYHALRRDWFVHEQGLFSGHDLDERDADPRTIVLVARDAGRGDVVGGVRLSPEDEATGWWMGSRLVVSLHARRSGRQAGSRLVLAACAAAESEGALRFEATVQEPNAGFFESLGWTAVRPLLVAGAPHRLMRWPVRRIQRLVERTKEPLGQLLAWMRPGDERWVGDDAAPVPASDLLATCDAILPAMVERDPEWAGWCGVLVGANDLAAMGATRLGSLNAVAAPDARHAARVLRGLREGAAAFGLRVLGGHTQLGVEPALSVTALGATAHPVPGGGGQPGHEVVLTADLGGRWRPGYEGRQWDSTSARSPAEVAAMLDAVALGRPSAAKDVSMAGVVGTLGMLAEASGCGAELDLARVPRPAGARLADWLTCFPGFAMLSADAPGRLLPAGPAAGACCGRLVAGAGVRLVWPDGAAVQVLEAGVTGLGRA